MFLWRQYDFVVELIRNDAGVHYRGEPSAASAAQAPVDGIVVNVCAAPAAAGAVTVGECLDDLLKLRQWQRCIRGGVANHRVELIDTPFAACDLRDQLLRQHIERGGRDANSLELAAPDGVKKRRAFDEIIQRQREQSSFRDSSERVSGAPDALQERADSARRAELDHKVNVADIDTELERAGRDQYLKLAALESLLRDEPMLTREAAMVRGNMLLADPLRKMARRAFRDSPLVDKYQRRAVFTNEFGEPIVNLVPDFVRHYGGQRRSRQLELEIAAADVAGIDN